MTSEGREREGHVTRRIQTQLLYPDSEPRDGERDEETFKMRWLYH